MDDKWKLVPREPTPEMISAFSLIFDIRNPQKTIRRAIKALIDVAPEPKEDK